MISVTAWRGFLFLAAAILAAATAHAAPIRVGIFKGIGGMGYWHASIHPGSAAIAAMLENPAQAGLQAPLIPARGFSVTMYGVDTSCHQAGCKPSAAQVSAFMAALDSLDAVVFPNNTDIGRAIENPAQRQRLVSFWTRKGVVSLHWSTDSWRTWAPWDSLHGTGFQQWQNLGLGTVRLDTTGFSKRLPTWRFLNRGLPDTARFRDEWIAFTSPGATIRSQPFLVPTVNLDEASLASTNNSPMGDHPLSWYREFPEGGRFFYTGMGDGASTYDTTYFFRRQLYNAILWAAGADSNGVVSARPAGRASAASPLKIGVSGSRVTVQVTEETPFTVVIQALDGRRVASRQGARAGTVVFTNLRPHNLYLVTVTTPRSRASRRIFLE